MFFIQPLHLRPALDLDTKESSFTFPKALQVSPGVKVIEFDKSDPLSQMVLNDKGFGSLSSHYLCADLNSFSELEEIRLDDNEGTRRRLLHQIGRTAVSHLIVSLRICGYIFEAEPQRRFFTMNNGRKDATGGFGRPLPSYRPLVVRSDDAPGKWDEKLFSLWARRLYPFYNPLEETRGRIGVALNAVLSGMSSFRREQQLLSYTIALESLLSSGSSEVSHQVSERAAFLLSEDPHRRRKFYDEVRRLYDIRSNIVHGNLGTKNWEAPTAISGATDPLEVSGAFTLCRSVLRRAFEVDRYHQALLAKKSRSLKAFFLDLIFGVPTANPG